MHRDLETSSRRRFHCVDLIHCVGAGYIRPFLLEPPLAANSSLFSILVAWPLGSVHVLCSIKRDSTALPGCPGALHLPCRHRNHHHCKYKSRPRPYLDVTIDLAGPGLRLADHSHLPSPRTPSWRSAEALAADRLADLCSVLTIDSPSGTPAQHLPFLMRPRPAAAQRT